MFFSTGLLSDIIQKVHEALSLMEQVHEPGAQMEKSDILVLNSYQLGKKGFVPFRMHYALCTLLTLNRHKEK